MTGLAPAPLIWITLTLAAYQVAVTIHQRARRHPMANPVLLSVLLVVPVLLVTHTPYETYFEGARFVHFVLGPATVAFAIPLHGQLARLKTMLLPLTVAVVVGSLTAITSAVGLAWLLGASRDTLLSLAPKSATMPVALGIAEQTGGVGSLTALAVTLTGVSGAMMAPGLLKLVRIDDLAVRGFAIGVASHAIGTASTLRLGESAAAFAALAMGLNAVATAVLLPLLARLVGGP
jgi:predicted murein hydrolase (TIGR00659 family)